MVTVQSALKNHTIPAFMAGIVLLVGIPVSLWIPGIATGIFDGPDGTRWVAPMGIWLSLAISLYLACLPLYWNRFQSVNILAE